MSEFGWFTFCIEGDHPERIFTGKYLKELKDTIAGNSGDIHFFPDTRYADGVYILESGGIDFNGGYPEVLEEMYRRCKTAGLTVSGGGYAEYGEHFRFSFDRDGKLEFASIEWMLEEPTAEEVRELHSYFDDMRLA